MKEARTNPLASTDPAYITPVPDCATSRLTIDISWANNSDAITMEIQRQLLPSLTGLSNVKNQSPAVFSPPDIFDSANLVKGDMYRYTLLNWDGDGRLIDHPYADVRAGQCPVKSSGALAETVFYRELLVPLQDLINDYIHFTSVINQNELWQHSHIIKPTAVDTGMSIKSVNLIPSITGKLEAIARVALPNSISDSLLSYELDPLSTTDWQGPVPISGIGLIENVTGSTAFIQSDYTHQPPSYNPFTPQGVIFDLLVPQGSTIEHYTHSSDTIQDGIWTHRHTLFVLEATTQATGASLTQSFSEKLEAVVRITPTFPDAGGDYLISYEFDPASPDFWTDPVKLVTNTGTIDQVTGSPSIIQSHRDNRDQFELLVPRGNVIDHYIHTIDNITDGNWQHYATLTTSTTGDQTQADSVWLFQNKSGDLEAAARLSPPGGGRDYLVGYQFDPTTSWVGPVSLVADDGPILAG